MRTIKQVLIILLVLLAIGHIATSIYQGSSDRKDPPTISCPSEVLEVSSSDDEAVLLTGITASDPQDGDLTDQVIVGGISKLISNNTAKVTFLVFDSDDNMGMCTRYIRYTDYQRPQFAIKEPLVYASTGEVSLLNRLSATDVVDGDVTNRVRVSTLSSTSSSEIYDITVQVTNSVGDTAWLQLPVLVQETDPLRPVITLNSYLIYVDMGSEFDPAANIESVAVNQAPGNVSDVSISSNVDTSKADTYRVTYTYNSDGKVGTAIATVVVQ